MRIGIFKRMVSVFLATVIVLGSLPATASAAVSKTEAYVAYRDFLLAQVEGIGKEVSEPDYHNNTLNPNYVYLDKIIAAHLLDVTGDGVEELILKRVMVEKEPTSYGYFDSASDWLCIYTYEGGRLRRVMDNNCWVTDKGNGVYALSGQPGYMPVISSYQYPNISNDTLLCYKGNNGRIYLQNDDDNFSAEGIHTLYAYNGSVFTTAKTFKVDFIHDWYIPGVGGSYYGKYKYYIDNASVSKSTYDAELKKYRSSLRAKFANNDYQTVLNTLKKATAGSSAPAAWSAESVNNAISCGYVPRRLQGNYNKAMTREGFCELAATYYEKMTGTQIAGRTTFDDTANPAVQKMAHLGVVNGVGKNRFAPYTPLNREQAATMLSRLADVMGIDLGSGTPSFNDINSISSWAQSSVGQLQNTGIMGGVGNNTFSPLTSYTCEQCILTLMRLDALRTPITSVTIGKSALSILAGGTFDLYALTSIDIADGKGTLQWSSSNKSVATVNSRGVITAVGAGKAIITATAPSGVSDQCVVSVSAPTRIDTTMKIYAEFPKTLTKPIRYRSYGYQAWVERDGPKNSTELTVKDVKCTMAFTGYISATVTVEVAPNTAKTFEESYYTVYPYSSINWTVEDELGNVVATGDDTVSVIFLDSDNGARTRTFYINAEFDMDADTMYVLRFS